MASKQNFQASRIKLADLKQDFGLTLVRDPAFFPEWVIQTAEPSGELSELEKMLLDRVLQNFSALLEDPPVLKNSVKMVVLSPLLDLAGFYRQPFRIESETSVEVEAEDEGEIIRGRIDVLVLRQRLWLLVIESKHSDFAVNVAIPQAIACMMGNPDLSLPTFGLVTNGNDFVFLKLVRQPTVQYGNSRVFSLLNPGNELDEVLQVLKQLGMVIL
jgi:hypothetical protein